MINPDPNQRPTIKEIQHKLKSIQNQSDSNLFDKNFQFLFDGNLSTKLLLSLNPKSTDKLKTICVNNALENNPLWKETYILPGTNLCNTYKLRDIISCLGGIKVIFPLFFKKMFL